jgi:hypothetical protein
MSMAAFIAEDCEPLGRNPKDYTPEAGFGGTRTHEEAVFLTEYEKRRVILAEWVQRSELDTIPPQNRALAEYYEQVSALSANPSAPDDFKKALQSLWRLYILNEQLAKKSDRSQYDKNWDEHTITSLIVRLVEELY